MENIKILVVDDHDLIREGTLGIIHEQYPEADLLSVNTATAAKEILQRETPNLAIIDLSLPEKAGMIAHVDTGIRLLKEMMEMYPDLNIMIQTSYVKALIRIKHEIDNHQGGLTIADKSLPRQEMLSRLEWCLQGITHTKELKTDLEIKPEWLEVLQFAFEDGLQDKAIAQKMYKSERMVRHYWTKIQDALEVYPEPGKNIRALTQIRAREEGLID